LLVLGVTSLGENRVFSCEASNYFYETHNYWDTAPLSDYFLLNTADCLCIRVESQCRNALWPFWFPRTRNAHIFGRVSEMSHAFYLASVHEWDG
jgi:hypothetical protein